MEHPLMEYYVLNGKPHSIMNREPLQQLAEQSVYEVLRVEEGIPVFFDEHADRLMRSAETVGKPLPITDVRLKEKMRLLVDSNGLKNGNAKILWGEIDGVPHLGFSVVEALRVTPRERAEGVVVATYSWERSDPNLKFQIGSYRERTQQKMREENAFELLLVDNDGCIREGSRSNFFWIRDGILYTPPAEHVLMGITRGEVLKAARLRGYEIREALLPTEEIRAIDAAFLTGTSIDVLPIHRIDNRLLEDIPHHLVSQLAADYRSRIDEDKLRFTWSDGKHS